MFLYADAYNNDITNTELCPSLLYMILYFYLLRVNWKNLDDM